MDLNHVQNGNQTPEASQADDLRDTTCYTSAVTLDEDA